MTELETTVKIAANGRMVLPQAVRQAIGIKGESKLILRVEDGEVRLSTVSSGVKKAQELYRKHVKHERSSDDFLATRERD
jgi:AbrB family looped-hinge helix DNA binding protein